MRVLGASQDGTQMPWMYTKFRLFKFLATIIKENKKKHQCVDLRRNTLVFNKVSRLTMSYVTYNIYNRITRLPYNVSGYFGLIKDPFTNIKCLFEYLFFEAFF